MIGFTTDKFSFTLSDVVNKVGGSIRHHLRELEFWGGYTGQEDFLSFPCLRIEIHSGRGRGRGSGRGSGRGRGGHPISIKIFNQDILAQEDATVIVSGAVVTAETNDNYICATIDWWPPEKCDYGQCPWGNASILNLDINHPFLANAIKAFRSLRIRIGGSLQNRVIYGVPGQDSDCHPFSKKQGGLFGFSDGCLSICRWDVVNALFQETGVTLTFGLNALYGRRHNTGTSLWEGAWNSTNARSFIEYTVSKGYPVDSWEFGNELSGKGVGAHVSYEQYAEDLTKLNAIINELYSDSHLRPLIVAPGGFFDQSWYAQLLQASGPSVVDAVTHHMYNLGPGNDPHLVEKIIDPKYLNGAANTFREVQMTIERHGSWSSPWVGESGCAYNSGGNHVSNTFLDSFWYLDQLGMAAKYNTKVYCRQSLVGGNYGLLDTESFIPNPDYYSALLWHQVMGKRVLSIDISGSPYLRAYAHCRKHETGISLLLINLSKTSKFFVTIRNDMNVYHGLHEDDSFLHDIKSAVSWIGRILDGTKKEEYHLTAKDGNHRGRTMLLNGIPLELTESGEIPAMDPVFTAFDSPVSVSPLSIAFVVLPDFEAQACL